MKINTKSPLLPVVALIISIGVVGAIEPSFFSMKILINLFADTATLFLMALGLTFVIMIGSIDLSVQAVAALSSIVLALMLPEFGYLSIIAALIVATVAGTLSGFTYSILKIPSFVATLAVGGIIASFGLFVSGQKAIQLDTAMRESHLSWIIGDTAGLPNEVWIALVVFSVALVIERATPFGKAVRAVGCNEFGARVAGVGLIRIKLAVFAIAGFMAGCSGVVLAARLAAGTPTIANEFLLPAIAAVVMGGTSLVGGTGGVFRTLVGTMLIAVFRTGMTFVGVNALAQQMVFGAILIIAVGLSVDRSIGAIVK